MVARNAEDAQKIGLRGSSSKFDIKKIKKWFITENILSAQRIIWNKLSIRFLSSFEVSLYGSLNLAKNFNLLKSFLRMFTLFIAGIFIIMSTVSGIFSASESQNIFSENIYSQNKLVSKKLHKCIKIRPWSFKKNNGGRRSHFQKIFNADVCLTQNSWVTNANYKKIARCLSILIIVENEKMSVRPPGAIEGNLQQKYRQLGQIFFQNVPVSTRLCGACNYLAGAIGGNASRLFLRRNRR